MSAPVLSAIATAQLLALSKGPGRGVSAPKSTADLKILDDNASIPVGAPAVDTTDYVRFGRIPKGAIIYPNLCHLSTDHTATIPGKLQLVPMDGVNDTQDITGVKVQREDLYVAADGSAETLQFTAESIHDVRASITAAFDSWIQFVPTSALTIESTAKTIYARIVYGQLDC